MEEGKNELYKTVSHFLIHHEASTALLAGTDDPEETQPKKVVAEWDKMEVLQSPFSGSSQDPKIIMCKNIQIRRH